MSNTTEAGRGCTSGDGARASIGTKIDACRTKAGDYGGARGFWPASNSLLAGENPTRCAAPHFAYPAPVRLLSVRHFYGSVPRLVRLLSPQGNVTRLPQTRPVRKAGRDDRHALRKTASVGRAPALGRTAPRTRPPRRTRLVHASGNPIMSNQIHGHDVLQIALDSSAPLTREALMAAMVERFGADAQYHTCSAESMDAEQLVALLVKRKKLHEVEGGFTTDPSRICKH